jgi:FkbM family methyltransferase
VTHSTNGEDDAIAEYFKRRGIEAGKFLDIGAANGITLSNTHLLAQNGWGGVCIDANAQELFNLNNLYWDNPKIEIVEGLICDGHGLKEFWNAKSANISTSSRRMQERGREREGARKCYVAGFTLDDIWERFGSNFEFINIDLEDGTLPIMRGLGSDVLSNCHALCVEHLRADWYFGEDEEGQIKEWGASKGFAVLARTDENVILCKG